MEDAMTTEKQYNLIVIGGGAAGFFAAIQYKEHYGTGKVLILEQSKNVLNKVKISGGGRCNVTNSIWEPRELVKYYPRGHFQNLAVVIPWVGLKTEVCL
jgi:predicted flavoprotein YhiN